MTTTEYKGWTDEAAARDAEAVEAGDSGGVEYWKVPVGTSRVRFLPALQGEPMVVTYQHFVEQPGRDKVVFACPKNMAKPPQPCPVCAKAAKLFASKNGVDREAAFGLKARLRVFAVIIDRKAPEKGPQVWGFGKTVFEQLRSLRNDPDIGDFFRPDASGFDIIVERKGTTKNDTEYMIRPAVNNCALGDLSILETAPTLGRQAELMPYADIVKKLKGEKVERSLPQEPAEPWDTLPTAGGTRALPEPPAPAKGDGW